MGGKRQGSSLNKKVWKVMPHVLCHRPWAVHPQLWKQKRREVGVVALSPHSRTVDRWVQFVSEGDQATLLEDQRHFASVPSSELGFTPVCCCAAFGLLSVLSLLALFYVSCF